MAQDLCTIHNSQPAILTRPDLQIRTHSKKTQEWRTRGSVHLLNLPPTLLHREWVANLANAQTHGYAEPDGGRVYFVIVATLAHSAESPILNK